jgi:hypothetical protein
VVGSDGQAVTARAIQRSNQEREDFEAPNTLGKSLSALELPKANLKQSLQRTSNSAFALNATFRSGDDMEKPKPIQSSNSQPKDSQEIQKRSSHKNELSSINNGNLMTEEQAQAILDEVRLNNELVTSTRNKVDSLCKMMSYMLRETQTQRYCPCYVRQIYQPLVADQKKEHLAIEHSAVYNTIGKGPNDTISKNDLHLLLKSPGIEYKYYLSVEANVEQTLVKERNFS